MNIAIDRFGQVLASPPDAVLPINSIGVKRPENSSEMPVINIALRVDDDKGLGYSRFVREGNLIVKFTALVPVNSSTKAFQPGLRTLAISPLPLKKNPEAVSKDFNEEDIQIHNITDPNRPVQYRMVENPTEIYEFKLVVPAAQIVFGQAQKDGDQLEIIHYTVTWRDEILGERYNGLLITELWTEDFGEANQICRKLQQKLRVNSELLRQKGYLKLRLATLDLVEHVLHTPPVGSSFLAFKQRLEYRFCFEAQDGGELSSGGIIKRVDVDVDDYLKETFSIPDNRNA